MTNAASSANRTGSNKELSEISFMYKINKSGPRTLPCGTPQRTERMCDLRSPQLTYCFLSLRYDFNNLRTLFRKP